VSSGIAIWKGTEILANLSSSHTTRETGGNAATTGVSLYLASEEVHAKFVTKDNARIITLSSWLALGTMNLVEWEFLLCEWSSFGLSALLLQLG